MDSNPIDQMTQAWACELPDLDTSPMATLAQVNRLSLLVNHRIEEALNNAGSSLAEFDVLSALRRQGAPYVLKPSELSKHVMLSPSGMTHRVSLLEAAALVERRADPSNRRILPVALTSEGIEVAERLVRLVVEVEAEILAALTLPQRSTLDRLVGRLTEEAAAQKG